MAGKSAIMSVRIVADASKASGELNAFERNIQKLEGKLDRLTAPAAVAGAGLVGFGTSAALAAAEAEQNFGAVDTVFKGAADSVHDWASEAANAVGMSSSSYENLAANIGGSLSKAGYSQDELAAKTNDLISAGADLSSVFGGDAAGAAEAMGAALRGEFDPLEQYGVFMNAAAIEARMAAEGTDKLSGAAYDAAYKQAAVNEIMSQAAQYQGNFAKEADTAAGAMERAKAQYQNASAQLGQALLPMLTAGATKLAEFARWVQNNQQYVYALAAVIGTFAAGVFAAKGAITMYQGAVAAVKIATQTWATAQKILNIALSANPIGLVVIAIAALVAAFIWAYKNVDWFRAGVDAAIQWIANAWGQFTSWLGQVWDTAIAWIVNSWNGMTAKASAAAQWVSDAFSAGVQWVQDRWGAGVDWVVAKYTAMSDGAARVAQWVSDAFSAGVQWVQDRWGAGVDWVVAKYTAMSDRAAAVAQWIGDAFSRGAQWVRDTWQAAVDWVVQKFSNLQDGASRAMDLVRDAFSKGVEIIKGYFTRLGENIKAVFDKIGGWADNIKSTISNLFNGFKMPKMPDWAKKALKLGGLDAFGYAQNEHTGDFYALPPTPGQFPFLVTAAEEDFIRVAAGAKTGVGQNQQTIVNNNFTITVPVGADRFAMVREMKKLFSEYDIVLGNA